MAQTVRILIAEDSAADVELMKRALRKDGIDFELRLASDEATFVRALDEGLPDILLTDYSMPSFDGLTAIRLLRVRAPDVPAILVSGAIGEERAIESLKAGATDYVLKDRMERLVPVVRRALDEARRAIEKKRAESALADAKQHLDAHINNSPMAVIESDSGFRITSWSDGAERIFGWRTEEVLGKDIIELHLVHDEDLGDVFERREVLRAGTHPRRVGVHRSLRKDGTVVWCEWYDSAVYDEDRRLVSVMSQVLDITDRKRAEDEREKLLRSSQRFSESIEHRDVLERARQAMQDALAGSDVSVVDVQLEDESVTVLSSTDERTYRPGLRLRLSELPPQASQAIESRNAVVVEDVPPPGPEEEQPLPVARHSALYLPLSVGDQLVGLVTAEVTSDRRPLTQGEVRLAESIGDQAAVALENTRLFEFERRSRQLSEALTAIDTRMHGVLSMQDMLNQVVREAGEAFGSDSAAILARRKERWQVCSTYGQGQGPELTGLTFTDEQLPHAQLVLESREPVIIEDAYSDARVEPSVMRAYHVRAVIVAPLIVRNEFLGAIFFGYHHGPRSFGRPDVDFVTRLSASLALAMTTVRLYEAEHEIAETLQTALLALPERIAGVEFAHAYRSATEAARVGGDFYDLFEVEHGLVGVTIGDMSGHGIESSALTSLVKNAIRVQAMEHGKTPAEILDRANRLLFRNSPPEIFATVFFGLLDCRDGRMAYCNAGHTTGVCLRSDGQLFHLGTNSPLVGAFHEGRFVTSNLSIRHDSLLFLYTDGLTEARHGVEFFGEDRLFQLLRESGGERPAEVVRHVLDDVLAFTNDDLTDDLALLALRREQRA